MLLRLFLIPILVLSLFGCTKSTPNATFSIEGLHDLVLDTAQSDISIPFKIAGTTGSSDSVRLSVAGLPSGLQASITRLAGLPPFSSELQFTQQSPVPLGTYPIMITAQTASVSTSTVIYLRVTAFNGWTFNNADFNQIQFDVNATDSPGYVLIHIRNSSNNSPLVIGYLRSGLPTTNGSYQYRIVSWDESISPGDMLMEYFDSNQTRFLSFPQTLRYATLNINSGKYSLAVPLTEMGELDKSNLTLLRTLSVHSRQP